MKIRWSQWEKISMNMHMNRLVTWITASFAYLDYLTSAWTHSGLRAPVTPSKLRYHLAPATVNSASWAHAISKIKSELHGTQHSIPWSNLSLSSCHSNPIKETQYWHKFIHSLAIPWWCFPTRGHLWQGTISSMTSNSTESPAAWVTFLKRISNS